MENKQLNINAQPYIPQNPLPLIMIPAQPTSPVVLAAFTYQQVIISDLSGYFYYLPLVIPSETQNYVYSPYGAVSDPMVNYHCTPIKNTFRKKNGFNKVGGGGGGGRWTTVMIRNIPNQFKRSTLVHFLDGVCACYRLAYDFLYLPIDFDTEMNLGYAFVNFTRPSAAKWLKKILDGFKWNNVYFGNFSSLKVCEIRWADIQGIDKLIEHFKKQTFLCDKNPDWFPIVFTPPRNGFKRPIGKNVEIGYCY